MNELSSKRIKKILIGVILSDGHIANTGKSARFDLYSKKEEYALYIKDVLNNLTGSFPIIYRKTDKRFSTSGFRVYSKSSRYFKKLLDIFYLDGVKKLSRYVVKRLDPEALAHVWMCDGMLHFKWNKKRDSVQIHGYFCLESFEKEELEVLIDHLNSLGITASLLKVRWGKGYRIKITGEELRKFISLIYDFVLPCFKYKCNLYYKSAEVLKDLPKTEQFVTIYDNLSQIEDIIRTRRNS